MLESIHDLIKKDNFYEITRYLRLSTPPSVDTYLGRGLFVFACCVEIRNLAVYCEHSAD